MTTQNSSLLNLLPTDLIGLISNFTNEKYKLDKKNRVKTIKYKCMKCKKLVYKRSFDDGKYMCKKCMGVYGVRGNYYNRLHYKEPFYVEQEKYCDEMRFSIEERKHKEREWIKFGDDFKKSNYNDFDRYMMFRYRKITLQSKLGTTLWKRIEYKDKIDRIRFGIDKRKKQDRINHIFQKWINPVDTYGDLHMRYRPVKMTTGYISSPYYIEGDNKWY